MEYVGLFELGFYPEWNVYKSNLKTYLFPAVDVVAGKLEKCDYFGLFT